MYSVAPLVVRKALQDVQIGQYTIPAGTAMILHVFAMHNTSANYDRHTEFLPVSHACPLACTDLHPHYSDEQVWSSNVQQPLQRCAER